jgi:peptidoglycan/LPS O-acetylase OafA/YrhL
VGLWLSVVGVAVIFGSMWVITSTTPWPGSAVLVPVLATGLVIAGGTMRESSGFWTDCSLPRLSLARGHVLLLYLVHWPILVIAAQYSLTGTISLVRAGVLVLVSIAVAAFSYYALENPLRNWERLKRSRVATYSLGAGLIVLSDAVIYWHLRNSGLRRRFASRERGLSVGL